MFFAIPINMPGSISLFLCPLLWWYVALTDSLLSRLSTGAAATVRNHPHVWSLSPNIQQISATNTNEGSCCNVERSCQSHFASSQGRNSRMHISNTCSLFLWRNNQFHAIKQKTRTTHDCQQQQYRRERDIYLFMRIFAATNLQKILAYKRSNNTMQ